MSSNYSNNPFFPGAKVIYPAKNRNDGEVIFTYCKKCENCLQKIETRSEINNCTETQDQREYICASFPTDTIGTRRRFKYHFSELRLIEDKQSKENDIVEDKTAYHFSHKDIKNFGGAELDVPLMDSSEFELIEESEVENTDEIKSGTSFAHINMFNDEYDSQEMGMPI